MITKDGINSSCLDTNAIVHYGIRLAIINIIISVTLATALAESTPAPWWTSIACPPYEIEGVALRCHKDPPLGSWGSLQVTPGC